MYLRGRPPSWGFLRRSIIVRFCSVKQTSAQALFLLNVCNGVNGLNLNELLYKWTSKNNLQSQWCAQAWFVKRYCQFSYDSDTFWWLFWVLWAPFWSSWSQFVRSMAPSGGRLFAIRHFRTFFHPGVVFRAPWRARFCSQIGKSWIWKHEKQAEFNRIQNTVQGTHFDSIQVLVNCVFIQKHRK